MKRILPSSFLAAVAAAFISALGSNAHACTGIGLTAADGSVAVGRTLEFGAPPESSVIVYPAGSEFQGQTPTGNGLKFTSKYAFVGANGFGVDDLILDGMNEKGLVVGLFYFPGYAKYQEPTAENQAKGIGPQQFGAWALGTCSSVEDVLSRINNIAVLPVVLPALKEVPGAHFKIEDASGKCFVIEPVDGKLQITENPVRVLTNAPEFSYHLTNLNNYLNQTPDYPEDRNINGLKLSPFGMGGGMVGIPGDYSPPSRFVRMVFFSAALPQQKDSPAAVAAIFHLLNNFDIPVGVAKPPAGTAEGDDDFTPWAAVADTKTLTYYYRTFGDMNIRHVNLKAALAANSKSPTSVFMGPQKPAFQFTSTDSTGDLK